MQFDGPSKPRRGAKPALLRGIPAVGTVLSKPAFRRLAAEFGPRLITGLLRDVLGGIRSRALDGEITVEGLSKETAPARLAGLVGARARTFVTSSPRAVINATGVVVHTNLGRSVLSSAAAARVAEAASSYLDLEYDLDRGDRGDRMSHLAPLLDHLFPGAGSAVFNNNAAAILIALRVLARGKEVVVSRGELVEIGGSFRVPEILEASGARLREVGTTNRTRAADYARALGPRTGAILKVHTSNFKIVGFAEEAGIGALAEVASKGSVPLVVDWGSGDLADLVPLGIHDEIPVSRILAEGADLVTFSGDKLLGGPQAGFAVGRKEIVARLRADPMARVCRVDRLLVAAIRETLLAYVRGREFEEIPTLAMLRATEREIGARARRFLRILAPRVGAKARLRVEAGVSRTGGGTSPLGERPTRLVVVELVSGDAGPLERALRQGDPPVLARIRDGRLVIDLRTVFASQERALIERLSASIAG